MERSRKSFRANLKGSDAHIWPNNLYTTAKVVAGMVFEVFGFMSYVSRQKFAHTAPDIESLILHGEEFSIPQKPAAPASGKVSIASDGAMTIAAGAIFRRADGVEFTSVNGGSQGGAGTIQVAVVAIATGKITNTIEGTALEVVSGVDAVLDDALAEVGPDNIALGADIENIEDYRARILFRKRNPHHGGSASDYVIWTTQVPGVTRVFVERLWNGPGTVRIFPLMDDLYQDGIPSGGEITRIERHLAALQPATARVTVQAPTPLPIDISISGLTPDTITTREAVLAELREAFKRLSRVAGDDVDIAMPYLAYPYSFPVAWIWQAVGNAEGVLREVVVTPEEDVEVEPGQIPVLGEVSFS